MNISCPLTPFPPMLSLGPRRAGQGINCRICILRRHAADAGSKAYSVSPQLPWQAEGTTMSHDAKEAMWGRTDDGVAFSGTVGSRLDSQMTRARCVQYPEIGRDDCFVPPLYLQIHFI